MVGLGAAVSCTGRGSGAAGLGSLGRMRRAVASQANRVERGILSYDAVVRLILGTRFDAGWTPRLRADG